MSSACELRRRTSKRISIRGWHMFVKKRKKSASDIQQGDSSLLGNRKEYTAWAGSE